MDFVTAFLFPTLSVSSEIETQTREPLQRLRLSRTKLRRVSSYLRSGGRRSRQGVEKTKIRFRETADVRKDRGQIALAAHAVPFCESRGIFVHRCRRDPASLADVVGTIDHERGIRAVHGHA